MTSAAAEMLGTLIALVLFVLVTIVLGVVLVVSASRSSAAARQRYDAWAPYAAPGEPVRDQETGEILKPKAGTGKRVIGIILIVIGALLLLGRMAMMVQ